MAQEQYHTLVAEREPDDISELDAELYAFLDQLNPLDAPRQTMLSRRMARQALDPTMESFDSCIEIDLKVRKDTIGKLVRKYSDDEAVLLRVSQSSKKAKVGHSKITAIDIGNKLAMFDVLDPEIQNTHFQVIDQGLSVYLEAVDKEKLSETEEPKVLDLVAAHQILLLTNMRFAYSRAVKYYRNNNRVPLETLVQEGNLGLIEAIRGFQVTKGWKFTTYAKPWVDRNIRNAYADESHSGTLTRGAYDVLMKLPREVSKLTTELGRKPINSEVANHLGIRLDTYISLMEFGAGLSSIDAPLHDANGVVMERLTVADALRSPHQIDAHFIQESAQVALDTIIDSSSLSDRSRLALGVEYGISRLRVNSELCPRYDNGQPIDYKDLLEELESGVDIEQREIAERYFGLKPQAYRNARTKGMIALRDGARIAGIDPHDLGFGGSYDIAV